MFVSETKCLSYACTTVQSIGVHYSSSAVEHICAMWQLICLEIYVKYMYSVHCHMVDCSDFVCGTYMCIQFPYKCIKIGMYGKVTNLVGIFVSSTYFAITRQICILVACFFSTYMQKCWVYMPT